MLLSSKICVDFPRCLWKQQQLRVHLNIFKRELTTHLVQKAGTCSVMSWYRMQVPVGLWPGTEDRYPLCYGLLCRRQVPVGLWLGTGGRYPSGYGLVQESGTGRVTAGVDYTLCALAVKILYKEIYLSEKKDKHADFQLKIPANIFMKCQLLRVYQPYHKYTNLKSLL